MPMRYHHVGEVLGVEDAVLFLNDKNFTTEVAICSHTRCICHTQTHARCARRPPSHSLAYIQICLRWERESSCRYETAERERAVVDMKLLYNHTVSIFICFTYSNDFRYRISEIIVWVNIDGSGQNRCSPYIFCVQNLQNIYNERVHHNVFFSNRVFVLSWITT